MRQRKQDERARRGLPQTGVHAQVRRRRVDDERELVLQRRLADEPFAALEARRQVARPGVLCGEAQRAVVVARVEGSRGRVERAREEAQGAARDLVRLELAAELAAEADLGRLEPVRPIALREEAPQALRHLVGAPRDLRELVLRRDDDRLGKVALPEAREPVGERGEGSDDAPPEPERHHEDEREAPDAHADEDVRVRLERAGRHAERGVELAAIEGRRRADELGDPPATRLHVGHGGDDRLARLARDEPPRQLGRRARVPVERGAQRAGLRGIDGHAPSLELRQKRVAGRGRRRDGVEVVRRDGVLEGPLQAFELRLEPRLQIDLRQVAALDRRELGLGAGERQGAHDDERDERERRRRDDRGQLRAQGEPHRAPYLTLSAFARSSAAPGETYPTAPAFLRTNRTTSSSLSSSGGGTSRPENTS